MKDDYLEDLKEWQEHQYVKGYYTGGRMPPFIKYANSPRSSRSTRMLRILMAVIWIPVLIAYFVMLIRNASGSIVNYIGVGLLISLTALLLYFSYGASPVNKKSRRRKRR